MNTYVVPARRVLTVLHLQDPDRQPGTADGGEPIDGWTFCGQPMLRSELWTLVQRQAGDRVCPHCEGHAGEVQEVLL